MIGSFDALRRSRKFICCKGQLGPFKIDVRDVLQRNQMHVCVRHFQPNHGNSNTFARNGRFNFLGDVLGKKVDAGEQSGIEIKKVVNLRFGNDQCVSFGQGIDVQKSQKLIILGDAMTGNVSCDNFTEDAGHAGFGQEFRLISNTSKGINPAGT